MCWGMPLQSTANVNIHAASSALQRSRFAIRYIAPNHLDMKPVSSSLYLHNTVRQACVEWPLLQFSSATSHPSSVYPLQHTLRIPPYFCAPCYSTHPFFRALFSYGLIVVTGPEIPFPFLLRSTSLYTTMFTNNPSIFKTSIQNRTAFTLSKRRLSVSLSPVPCSPSATAALAASSEAGDVTESMAKLWIEMRTDGALRKLHYREI
eukprot:GFKZ01004075.1.p1 GENE.GFKZ01004075.1~~GFKZ01004075.1.p1  ORF type:complete len:206 (+),score=6.25 GFKZ01004075.1:333-950(+)